MRTDSKYISRGPATIVKNPRGVQPEGRERETTLDSDTESDPGSEDAPALWTGFVASSPLLSSAAVLFVAGYLVWRSYPSFGPGAFPLWDLLLVLGFVAGIGAVLSWFYATDDTPHVAPRPRRAAPPRRIPEGARPVPATFARGDLGRPRPEIASRSAPRRPPATRKITPVTRPRASPPPWQESEDDEEVATPSMILPPGPAAARSSAEADAALDELDGIEQDIARRRRGGRSATV